MRESITYPSLEKNKSLLVLSILFKFCLHVFALSKIKILGWGDGSFDGMFAL